MIDGRTASLVLLYQACYYDAFAIETDATLQAANTHPRIGTRLAFNETGLALARAITLDCLPEAEIIYRCLVAGLEDNLFYGVEATQVTPYLLTLYAQWKTLPLSDAIVKTAQGGVYGSLLAMWQTEDEDWGEQSKHRASRPEPSAWEALSAAKRRPRNVA